MQRLSSERGSLVIQVGVGILALSAFTMFVVDYGILWVSRNQTQNAADAAAMSAAVSLAFDPPSGDPEGDASAAARAFAASNQVWGEAPVGGTLAVAFPGCAGGDCVRVDVYRDSAHGNPLPMWFGELVGVTEQGVRASGTAMAARANASRCLKPWGLADLNGAGQRFSVADLGTPVVMSLGEAGDTSADITEGWLQPLVLNPDTFYELNITGCPQATWTIGDSIPLLPDDPNIGATTYHALQNLFALDEFAAWDGSKVVNSCARPESYTCDTPGYSQSPRIISVPVFAPASYSSPDPLVVTNIVGMFLESRERDGLNIKLTGRLMKKPDLRLPAGPEVPPEFSFVKTIQLVR